LDIWFKEKSQFWFNIELLEIMKTEADFARFWSTLLEYEN